MKYDVQNVMLQLSGVCNYRCRMCGHPEQNHGLMSNEIFEKIIKDCKQSGIHTLIFAGSWGEPTLHPDWEIFLKKSVDSNFNTILSTNGSRLNLGAINFLTNSGLKSIQISFAGFDKKSYESTYINGDFSFIKTMLVNVKKIFKTSSHAPEILINGVVEYDQPENFVDKTYHFLYSCGYSDAEINIVRPNNFGGKLQAKKILRDKRISKSNLQLCSVLRDVVGIYWDGKVTACACLDNDRKMLIGNIIYQSITYMRSSNNFNLWVKCFEKKDLTSLEMCSKCDVPYGDERNIKITPSWQQNDEF